jgi:hypothetical protein
MCYEVRTIYDQVSDPEFASFFPAYAAAHHSISEGCLQKAYSKNAGGSCIGKCFVFRDLFPNDCFHVFFNFSHKYQADVCSAVLPYLFRFTQRCDNREPRVDQDGLILEQDLETWKDGGFRSTALAMFLYNMASSDNSADRYRYQQEFCNVASSPLVSDKQEHKVNQSVGGVLKVPTFQVTRGTTSEQSEAAPGDVFSVFMVAAPNDNHMKQEFIHPCLQHKICLDFEHTRDGMIASYLSVQ